MDASAPQYILDLLPGSGAGCVNLFWRSGCIAKKSHGHLFDRMNRDSLDMQPAFLLDLFEPRIYPLQAQTFDVQLLAQLGLFQGQHPAQLACRQLVVQNAAHLLERYPKVVQCQDAVEPRQLIERVIAVTGVAVDPCRAQQSHLGIEPQGLYGHVCQL